MSKYDEDVQLRPETLAVLEEFLKEKEEKDMLNRISEENEIHGMSFDENWQLSQFWYDEKTMQILVKGAINSTPADGKIALISCPTLYTELKKNCKTRQVVLLEYDTRFQAFGTDFVPYDYKFPLNIPEDMSGSFDLLIADPPFLSDECLTKTATTIKLLAKKNIIICTGAVMADSVERLLNAKKCDFIPRHKNNLANEFYCYANFNFDEKLK